jgi:hypothetical protein
MGHPEGCPVFFPGLLGDRCFICEEKALKAQPEEKEKTACRN